MNEILVAPTVRFSGSVQPVRNESVNTVFKTSDYGKFSNLSDNRQINRLHVKRLTASFNDRHLMCPIIVNEKMEVIDGQHRLQAAIESDKPVHYIVVNGYGIREVQILNANQKNWNHLDFLNMFCADGKQEYLEFRNFMNEFSDFGFQSCEKILSGKMGNGRQGKLNGHKYTKRDFEEGNFQIPNLERSKRNARKLMDFKPYYSNYGNANFVAAILPLFTSKLYNHNEMLNKLSICPDKIVDAKKVQYYRAQIEEIYNYKRPKENKVSFKYE